MKYKAIPVLIFLLFSPTHLSFAYAQPVPAGKDLPKIAVWDLTPGDIKPAYAQDLTSILVSEITKLGNYEVYSQENVRTLAGWTAERMQLGCTDTKCLTALGQMDIAKLISGRIGKIGNRYSVSLHLFDTQNIRAENSISEECKSEDELIHLVRQVVRKLLGIEVASSKAEEKVSEKATTGLTSPAKQKDSPRTEMMSPLEALKQIRELERQEQEQQVKKRPFIDPITGMEFIFVKGGCYEMGDTLEDGRSDAKAVHWVCVDDFYLGKYEVTQGQWEKVMGNNPSYHKGRANPVEQVSWDDVQQFIDRLNNQGDRKYRLPTEAEWEYAARSGGKMEKYSGTSQEADLAQYAWYKNNSSEHQPVGGKWPNGLGLYDMSGNVSEWCADWYAWDYYKNSPKDNPRGPENGQVRVLRGGSWFSFPYELRAAWRKSYGPADKIMFYGFRLASPFR